jgi:hypothetical protein
MNAMPPRDAVDALDVPGAGAVSGAAAGRHAQAEQGEPEERHATRRRA